MKFPKTSTSSKLVLTGLAALAFSGAALAQQPPIVIYISGANGDRATTNTAIPKLLEGETYVGTNASPTSANYATWKGGTFNGIPVTVKASYQGAAAGIAQVAGSLPGFFLPDEAVTPAADPSLSPGGVPNPRDPGVPQIAMSTNFQSTTVFNGLYNGHFYEDLSANDTQVSVVGLKWVASPGFPATNITPQAAQYLFGSGVIPLSFFSGLPADNNKLVYATGRNLDAGQRFVAQAESGIGIYGVVKHYKPAIADAATTGGFLSGGTVTSHALWPIESYSGVSSQFEGNGGQDTGRNLASLMTATLSENAYKLGGAYPQATAGWYVSYLTPQDADLAISRGTVELSWNGVPYSAQNIAEGRYTFWTYEHVMYRSSLSGTIKEFADALANQILTVDASVAGIFMNDVKVSRSGEGTLVKAKYF